MLVSPNTNLSIEIMTILYSRFMVTTLHTSFLPNIQIAYFHRILVLYPEGLDKYTSVLQLGLAGFWGFFAHVTGIFDIVRSGHNCRFSFPV